jgi:hypothetical protein
VGVEFIAFVVESRWRNIQSRNYAKDANIRLLLEKRIYLKITNVGKYRERFHRLFGGQVTCFLAACKLYSTSSLFCRYGASGDDPANTKQNLSSCNGFSHLNEAFDECASLSQNRCRNVRREQKYNNV